ncbi:MAG: transposase [bacterium]|nr:transposase [bacterium]
MQESAPIDAAVFVGVDIAKGDHYACAVTREGAEVLARVVPNDEAAIGRLIDEAAGRGAEPQCHRGGFYAQCVHDVLRHEGRLRAGVHESSESRRLRRIVTKWHGHGNVQQDLSVH